MKTETLKLVIYTDGGARGNPGPAGIGAVFVQEGQIIKRYGEVIGEKTNNQAEYEAVIFALKKAKLLFGKDKLKKMTLEIRSDSELMVRQLNHRYKIKESDLALLFLEVWNLMLNFKEVSFVHIEREKNKEADKLVNEALDGKNITQSLL